jgi:Glyoxalase-like domain
MIEHSAGSDCDVMTVLAQIFLVLTSLFQGVPAQQSCVGAPSAPVLDHVVLVVRDLEIASAEFQKQGFRLKPGRLHPNNLLNRHIKFRDGSEIELMTVQGRPGDAMAQRYLDLLEAGEGGVYVALSVADITLPQRAASELRLETHRSASGSWQFLGFPSSSPAAAVFFSAGVPAVRDPPSLVMHDPDVAGLAEAWIEGGSAVGDLLSGLGARRCGAARSPDGQVGERWALSRGTLVVLPSRLAVRPRLLGVVLQRRTPGESAVYRTREFWVCYAFDRE